MKAIPFFAVLAVWATFTRPVESQQARAEVLVLGVYHMANPGRDVFTAPASVDAPPRRIADALYAAAAKRGGRVLVESRLRARRAAP